MVGTTGSTARGFSWQRRARALLVAAVLAAVAVAVTAMATNSAASVADARQVAIVGGADGRWLVGGDGVVTNIGTATAHRTSIGAAVAGVATPTGNGYWLVAQDGGIFAFGDATFHGSLGGHWVNDVVGIVATASGYAIADANGRVAEFGGSRPGVHGDEWTVPTQGREASIAAQVHSKMNDERVARGLPPLMWDTELAATATSWSLEMSSSGFRHSDVSGTMGRVGGLDRLAENIFRGSLSYADAGSAHLGFMQSAEHRHTLLASAYTTAGVGVRCDAAGQLWVTVHFAAPTGHAPAGTRPPTTAQPVASPDQGGAGC